MAYSIQGLACISSPPYTLVPNIWGYVTTTDTIAQVSASGYFPATETRLEVNDAIRATCSDGTVWLRVASLSPTTTVVDTNAVSNLLDGYLWVGNAANAAVAVLMSGDATMDNAGVVTLAANSVVTSNITDLNVTTGKLAANAVTSAKIALNVLQYAAVPITAAEFNGMYAAPKLLVAAAGADTLIVLDRVVLAMTYDSAAYAAGGVAAVQYDDTANGAGVIASTTLAAASFQDTASTVYSFNAGVVEYPFATCVNQGLYLSNITGAFTTGDSDMVAHVWYKVIPTV